MLFNIDLLGDNGPFASEGATERVGGSSSAEELCLTMACNLHGGWGFDLVGSLLSENAAGCFHNAGWLRVCNEICESG